MTEDATRKIRSTVAPTALVIFGITGNLAKHMLLPALYHLLSEGLLPEKFEIVGVFRREPDIDDLLQEAEIQLLRDHDNVDPDLLAALRERIHPIKMDSTDPEGFKRMAKLLAGLEKDTGMRLNRLFYLAIPPSIFKKVIDGLSSAGLNVATDGRASRILVEKPFGYDLTSAQELIDFMSARFTEEQIYRIDHYLAKETAQNILTFRFNNPLIEGIWSRQFIDHIQITAIEKIGIQGRVAFYENMGALRDFVQSHLMQLMALVMMEYPPGLTAETIHKEKLLLLESIEQIAPKHVEDIAVRGQYADYRTEVGNSETNTETFAAVKLEVANSRWGGVPVLMRTGKSVAAKATEITVVFKDRTRRDTPDNLLTIRIQPGEGISLKLLAKKPGFSTEVQPVIMDFSYASAFDGHQPDAYERVLIDAMRGDQSLFATSAEVLASWRLIQPILDTWRAGGDAPETYVSDSWGPDGADQLAASFGSSWVNNPYEPIKKEEETE